MLVKKNQRFPDLFSPVPALRRGGGVTSAGKSADLGSEKCKSKGGFPMQEVMSCPTCPPKRSE